MNAELLTMLGLMAAFLAIVAALQFFQGPPPPERRESDRRAAE